MTNDDEPEFDPHPVFYKSSREVKKKTDQAIRRVSGGANKEWMANAEDAAFRTALHQEEFCVDHIWPHLPGEVTTRDERAMGAILQKLKNQSLIADTGRKGYSGLASKNHGPQRIWRSLIFDDPDLAKDK